jgi:hypothetical protein
VSVNAPLLSEQVSFTNPGAPQDVYMTNTLIGPTAGVSSAGYPTNTVRWW